MLRPGQTSVPAQTLLKSIHDEEASCFPPLSSFDYLQHHHRAISDPSSESFLQVNQQAILGGDADATSSSASSSSFLASIPKTVPPSLGITHTSGSDLSSFFAPQDSASVAASAHSRADSSASHQVSTSTRQSASKEQRDPSQMSGSNYQFETQSLGSSMAPAFSSSPAVGDQPLGSTGERISPAQPQQVFSHEQLWNREGHVVDQEGDFESQANSTPVFPATFTQNDNGMPTHSSTHHLSPNAAFSGHGPNSNYLHRASISGPLMESTAQPARHEQPAAPSAPAPPRVHALAAWENASGSARPHTADGLFGHFGIVPGGSHDNLVDGSIFGQSSSSTSRPYTPAGPSGSLDPYFSHRRTSLTDADGLGGGGKIFSYMPPMDDGMMSAPSHHHGMGMPGSAYAGHYFSGLGGFHGNSSKKRPRRRYDEIERLYPCSWPGCNKSYGTLNHLNAHVAMQKHGPKRSPTEFKDMRKAWRKQKKEEEQRRQARQSALTEQAIVRGELTRPSTTHSYGSAGVSVGTNGMASSVPISGPPSLGGGFGGGPLGPPPALSGPMGMGGVHHNPLSNLSRYTMSSVAAPPSSNSSSASSQPFFFNVPPASANDLHTPGGSASHLTTATNYHGQEGSFKQESSAHHHHRPYTAVGPGFGGTLGNSADSHRPYTAAGSGFGSNLVSHNDSNHHNISSISSSNHFNNDNNNNNSNNLDNSSQYQPTLNAYLSVHRGSV